MSDSDDEAAELAAELAERQEIAAKAKKRSAEESMQSAINARAESLGLVTYKNTMEEKYKFLPGQSDECAICSKTTPLNNMLYNSSCIYPDKHGINKGIRGTHTRHRICEACWFDGKDGAKPFAAQDSDHTNCPGCLKGQPIFTPRTEDEGLSRAEKRAKNAAQSAAQNVEVIEL
jgi:hypothetical protein